MGTRSVISVNKETKLGIYKHSDGYPSSTIPSILTYIAIFGYVQFKKEIKRIGDSGGCSFFYYVHAVTKEEYEHGFEAMLETEQLNSETFDQKPEWIDIMDQEYGYLVLNNEITIYHPWADTEAGKEKTIRYNKKTIQHLVVEGIFGGNIEQVFVKKYRLK